MDPIAKSNFFKKSLRIVPQREMMRRTKLFKDTNRIWNKYGHNRVNNIGSLSYITDQLHTNWNRVASGIVPKKEFVLGYIASGGDRQNLIRVGSNLSDTAINRNYGRTFQELYDVAYEFKKDIDRELGVDISLDTVCNYVYIRIFDETYEGYLREKSVIAYLSSKYFHKYNFYDADPYMDNVYAVDIIVENKQAEIVLGIQLKPASYMHINDQSHSNAHSINEYKNSLFKDHYGVNVIFLYYNSRGNIVNEEALAHSLL